MEGTNSFGNYLKARRRLVTPEQAGIPRGSRRRVAGLRREEVALLAAISPEYYLRLEQGRDHNPSASVLDALATVLQLDDEAAAYLHRLARAAPTGMGGIQPEGIPPGVAQLIDELPVPTFVQGRWMDVLAANRLAQALSPHYRKGINLLRAVFLDPGDRILHQDWERATREAVSGLTGVGGNRPGSSATDRVGGRVVRCQRALPESVGASGCPPEGGRDQPVPAPRRRRAGTPPRKVPGHRP